MLEKTTRPNFELQLLLKSVAATSSLRNMAFFENQHGLFLVPRFIMIFHPFVRRFLTVLPQE